MNGSHYLVISGIVGGVIGSLLTALLVSPVTAGRDKFGEIECTKLTVVDAEGVSRIMLTVDTRDLVANLKKSGVILFAHDILGAGITACGKDGERQADLRSEWGSFQEAIGEHGGRVVVWGKDGEVMVELRSDEQGGVIDVRGKGRGAVNIDIDEHGNGAVSILDKNGDRQ